MPPDRLPASATTMHSFMLACLGGLAHKCTLALPYCASAAAAKLFSCRGKTAQRWPPASRFSTPVALTSCPGVGRVREQHRQGWRARIGSRHCWQRQPARTAAVRQQPRRRRGAGAVAHVHGAHFCVCPKHQMSTHSCQVSTGSSSCCTPCMRPACLCTAREQVLQCTAHSQVSQFKHIVDALGSMSAI
jgi:hypothetical protein